MICLYTLSHSHLLFILTLYTIAVVLAVVSLTCDMRVLNRNTAKLISFIYDCIIITNLFIFSYILIYTHESFYSNQYILINLSLFREIILFTLLFASVLYMYITKEYNEILTIIFSIAISPFIENRTAYYFPAFLAISCFYFIFRSIFSILRLTIYLNNNLNELSVKEAVDTLDFGILFCKITKSSNGQIILCNKIMQDIMRIMTGKIMYNGKKFYDMLVSQEVSDKCFINDIENELVYTLPNNTYWIFEVKYVNIKKFDYAILTCTNVTELRQATYDLNEKLNSLQERNSEISNILKNIEDTCKTNETINLKCHVHDLLGQKISLIVRSVREHIYPDKTLLNYFSEGLFHELNTQSTNMIYNISMLEKDFKGLNVKLNTTGDFPKDPKTSRIFFEISLEAITNAIRHGYASEISVRCFQDTNNYILNISDNGLINCENIKEGLGLKSMRNKVSLANGSFSYTTTPSFKINITLPIHDKEKDYD